MKSAKELKETLEKNVKKLVEDFIKKTGVEINYIDVQEIKPIGFQINTNMIKIIVKIN